MQSVVILIIAIPLTNAAQSSTYLLWGCAGNKCVAAKAIDGDYRTRSLTNEEANSWWHTEFKHTVTIERILIKFLWYYMKNYKNLKVETRIKDNDSWTLCNAPHTLEENSIVHCNQRTSAKYLKLSGNGRLGIVEVGVYIGI